MTDAEHQSLITAIEAASGKWIASFNSGDAAGCARAYEEKAVMNASPFGTFTGRAEIQAFWENIIADGFTDVEYVDPQLKILDATSGVITSKWRMNKAHEVITKELWVLQDDGTALLREDDFKVQG